jgi:elongation factor Ts
MGIDTKQIQELRTLTGAGVMDCKRALEQAHGEFGKAQALLDEQVDQKAQKKADRAVKEGVVDAYLHGDGRIGVLIEVLCETDFLSLNPEFRSLVRDLALQVAAEDPQYVSAQEVPAAVLAEVEQKAEATALALGKPDRVIPQIKAGKVKKFLAQVCLLEQRFIKDQEVTVGSLVQNLTAKSGENIRVSRFTRYQLTD